MKYILILIILFLSFSCSETSKYVCESDDDCSGERVCDLKKNTCITCKPDLCIYQNAEGVCKKFDDGKVRCAMGNCDEGYTDLDKNEENGCEYACIVTNNGVEVCDSTDNNCNGEVDEGLDCSCNDNEINECTVLNTSCKGNQKCVSGTWGECEPENDYNGVEICDGLDNDCNDGIDEDFKINGVYAVKEHCGACNKGCDDIHSVNNCSAEGVCVPECEEGWNNFDKDGYNGCETGCDSYSFQGALTKEVVSFDTGDTDAIYFGDKIYLGYVKPGADKDIVVAKIIDKDANVIKDETLISDDENDKHFLNPEISTLNDSVLFLYSESSNKLILTVKDGNLNLGDDKLVFSSAYNNNLLDYSIAKDNLMNNVYIAWTSRYSNLGGGTPKDIIHYQPYSYDTGELGEHKLLQYEGDKDIFSPKIATVSSPLNGDYIAIAYCEVTSNNSSVLHLYVSLEDDTNKDAVLDSFSNANCNDFFTGGSIKSGGQAVYVSYIKKGSLNIKKLMYVKSSDALITGGEFKLSSSDNLSFVNTVLNYKKDNVILGYTIYEKSGSDTISLISYKKAYARLTKDLEFKDKRVFISAIGIYLNTKDNCVFYTDDNEVISVFKKISTNSNRNIRIARTVSCEN